MSTGKKGGETFTNDTINSEFAINAAKGAELARKGEEAKLATQQKNAEERSLSSENFKPLRDAIKSLSHIKGFKASISAVEGRSEIASDLKIGGWKSKDRYSIIISPSGYSIKRSDAWTIDAPKEAIAKKNVALAEVLQSVALIAGFHYPDKAAEIADVINKALDQAKNPSAAKSSRTLAQKFHLK